MTWGKVIHNVSIMNINEYVKAFGLSKASSAFGVTEASIKHWIYGVRPIPVERVIVGAAGSGWVMTPHELKPEFYPNPTDALPPERLDGHDCK